MSDNYKNQWFRLGQWTVDPDRLICSAGDTVEQLRPKHMAVLVELAHRSPAVVSRSTLIDQVWPRGFVNPNVLNNAVSKLRKQLDGSESSLIETIPRHGYRLTVAVNFQPAETQQSWSGGSPYRGLASYDENHSAVFFGRSREIAEVVSALEHQAAEGQGFVMLLGASGVGKTSLINAGVVPAITNATSASLQANWCSAAIRIATDHSPWHALANAFGDALGTPDLYDLMPTLENDFPAALQRVIDALDSHSDENKARMLLVLDHLELLLGDPAMTKRNESFFAAIHETVRTGRIWVIAGLRNDYYQECGRFQALSVLRRGRGQFDVSTPDAEQIGRIIREPALAAGLTFETDPATDVSLDDHIQASAASRPDVLPLLQFCLETLYERRDTENCLTYAALAEVGGLEQAMARRAEALFESLDDAARNELPVVLSAMVRLSGASGHRYSRRFANASDLVTTVARERLVETFVSGRLFITDVLNGAAVISVVHESLFKHWARARNILEDNHQLLAFSKRLSDASNTWEDNARSDHYLLGAGPLNESEQLLSSDAVALPPREIALIDASRGRAKRSKRLRQFAVAGLAALAVSALVAAGIATTQRRDAITEAARANQTTDFLVQLFQLANPGPAGSDNLTAKQVLDLGATQLSRQLNQQPEVRSALLQTIGNVYTNLGAYDAAEPLLVEALELRQSGNAPNFEIAQTMNSLGKLDYFRGHYDKAATNYQRALELFTESRSRSNAVYADTQNNLGEVTAALGDYDQATLHHQTALNVRVDLFGAESSETGTSIQNLAGVLRRNGSIEKAEELYRQAISIHESVYGPAHPEVAVALANLGTLLTDSERYDESQPLLQRALNIRRDVFGDKHLHTANSLHNLSAMLFRKGDYANAEPVLIESLALHIELFGADHDSVAYGRNNLATLLLETKREAAAQEMFGLAFDTLSMTLGDEHPNTALIRGNLAKAALAAGEHSFAVRHAGAAVDTLTAALPADHWRLAAVKIIYGSALTATDEYDQAERILLESWQALSESHGADSEMGQRAIAALVELYGRSGNQDGLREFENIVLAPGSVPRTR